MNITKSVERINAQHDVERHNPKAIIQRFLIAADVAKSTPGMVWAADEYMRRAREVMLTNGIENYE